MTQVLFCVGFEIIGEAVYFFGLNRDTGGHLMSAETMQVFRARSQSADHTKSRYGTGRALGDIHLRGFNLSRAAILCFLRRRKPDHNCRTIEFIY